MHPQAKGDGQAEGFPDIPGLIQRLMEDMEMLCSTTLQAKGKKAEQRDDHSVAPLDEPTQNSASTKGAQTTGIHNRPVAQRKSSRDVQPASHRDEPTQNSKSAKGDRSPRLPVVATQNSKSPNKMEMLYAGTLGRKWNEPQQSAMHEAPSKHVVAECGTGTERVKAGDEAKTNRATAIDEASSKPIFDEDEYVVKRLLARGLASKLGVRPHRRKQKKSHRRSRRSGGGSDRRGHTTAASRRGDAINSIVEDKCKAEGNENPVTIMNANNVFIACGIGESQLVQPRKPRRFRLRVGKSSKKPLVFESNGESSKAKPSSVQQPDYSQPAPLQDQHIASEVPPKEQEKTRYPLTQNQRSYTEKPEGESELRTARCASRRGSSPSLKKAECSSRRKSPSKNFENKRSDSNVREVKPPSGSRSRSKSCEKKKSDDSPSVQTAQAETSVHPELLLDSPSSDPRLRTPESERQRFAAVKFRPGAEVRMRPTSAQQSKCGGSDLDTAKATTPIHHDIISFNGLFQREERNGQLNRLAIQAELVGSDIVKLTLNGKPCRIR